MSRHATLALGLLCCSGTVPAAVGAQSMSEPRLGTAATALPGLVRTGLPTSAAGLNLSGSAGYGVSEEFESIQGTHHRGTGTVAVGIVPLSWLALSLRFDGRLDVHSDDGGARSFGVGEPRLLARVGHQIDGTWSLGAELEVWVPGTEAPSFELSATTVDLEGLVALAPAASRWTLLGALGFRLDNSANSAPDLRMLGNGDRLAFGLSDFHAVLAALGAAYRASADVEIFSELSADLLVGARAPDPLQSPLRAAVGGRYFVSRRLQAELTSSVSLSSRPEITPSAPLVPIEPRFAVMAGLRYGLLADEPRDAFARRGAPTAKPRPFAQTGVERASVERAPVEGAIVEPAVAEAAPTTLSGVLLDEHQQPLPEARVRLQTADGERETITDGLGRYEFQDVPPGPVRLEASAIDFEALTWNVDVHPGMMPEPARALEPKAAKGILRCVTRSFRSKPLRAEVTVRDAAGNRVATGRSDDAGRFEIGLPPGKYHVTISAAGHGPQSRSVKISNNEVAILNMDMREQK